MKKKLIVMVLASLMASGSAFAAISAGNNQPNGNNASGGFGGSSTSTSTASQERQAKKANSAECKAKAEANQRERDDDLEKEDDDLHRGHLSHDSHASAHKADTHHDDMVRADRDRESAHENERKLLCGEIDDGKSLENEHDDADRQAQHDRENADAETQQHR